MAVLSKWQEMLKPQLQYEVYSSWEQLVINKTGEIYHALLHIKVSLNPQDRVS